MTINGNTELEEYLRQTLTAHGLSVWRHGLPLLDLMWGMSVDTLREAGGSIVIEASTSQRRIQAHAVGSEIRYWLATHSDPVALSSVAKGELGIVQSADDLAALCVEFLTSDLMPDELKTRRTVGSSL